MPAKWNTNDEIFLKVKVNKENLIGLISIAKSQMEDLQNTIRQLENVLETEAIDKNNAPSD